MRAAHNYTLWHAAMRDAKRKSPAIPIPISIRETNHNSCDSHSVSDSGFHFQAHSDSPDNAGRTKLEMNWVLHGVAMELRTLVGNQ